MGRNKNYFAFVNYYTIQHKRKQKFILEYQTEIPIYELSIATKIISVFELWP